MMLGSLALKRCYRQAGGLTADRQKKFSRLLMFKKKIKKDKFPSSQNIYFFYHIHFKMKENKNRDSWEVKAE